MQRSSPEKLQVGIVGIGFGQQVHLPVFQAHPQCEVVAICASTHDRAAAVAARNGIPQAFGDWRALVSSPEIDAVSIALPPSQQPLVIRNSLESGKHIFCEKPVGCAAEQVADLVQLAQARQLANVVDFEFPEITAFQRAKTIIASGELGVIRHVAVNWNVETYANKTGANSWKTRLEDGGGALYSFASHSLYYLEWLLGKIVRLSARLGRASDDTRSGDTVCMMSLELASNCLVSLSISSHAFLGSGHKLEIYGTNGTLILENPTTDYMNGFALRYGTRVSNRMEHVPTAEASGQADGRVAAVAPLVSRFIDWCITGRATSPTLADGWRVQKLLDSAQIANDTGCWLNVAEE